MVQSATERIGDCSQVGEGEEAAGSRGFPGWPSLVGGNGAQKSVGQQGRGRTAEWLGTCSEEPVCPGVDLLTLTS